MDRRFDPRSIVTPYAFAVHPDLLGVPLATPWQRLGAILVDLIVIGFISQIGVGPLAVASTLLLFFLATRKAGRDVFGKVFRVAAGCLGFVVLTVTVLVALLVRHADDLEDLAREVLQNHKRLANRVELSLQLLRNNQALSGQAGLAVTAALYLRYMKRVSAHLKNVATSVVNPFYRIGFREKKKKKI